jgi:hypothetical protein
MAIAPTPHVWYTPADCAALLLGVRHGEHYRAPCPVCDSTRPDALSIRQLPDKYGNPCTVFHCFAHDCDVRDICAALGIAVRNLFAIHPDYARETRYAPRARSPRIDRLKTMEEPTPDEIAQILLEEMIVSDPKWIETCEPARQKMWELAQDPAIKRAFITAMETAHIVPRPFWDRLQRECGGPHE